MVPSMRGDTSTNCYTRNKRYIFLWSYKKICINRVTTAMAIQDGRLGTIDIETQCKAIKCAILSKFFRDIQENKSCTEIMLWHLNRFRDAKQGINLFKIYITNTNRGNKLVKFYKDLLTAWTDLTNNEKVDPITLPEIYNEPLFLILVLQRQLWHSCHKHKYKRYMVIFRNYILYSNIFIMRKHVFN